MQGSKRARNTPSISNQGSIYGIMGGMAPRVGLSDTAVYRHQLIKGAKGDTWQYTNPYYNNPAAQKQYMFDNKIVSVNPLKSGGVGKRVLFLR